MKFYVQLAVFREREDEGEKSRTMLRGIHHQALTEAEANAVFQETCGLLKSAAKRHKRQYDDRQNTLFSFEGDRADEKARKAG